MARILRLASIVWLFAVTMSIGRSASGQIVVSWADGTVIPAVDGVCRVDFGEVNAADTAAASRRFLLTNDSDSPLTIGRVATSCGCTSTTLTANGVGASVGGFTSLPAHGELTLSMSIDTGRLMSGSFDKFVWVYLADSRVPTVSIEAVGSLDRLAAFRPGSIDFGTVISPATPELDVTATIDPALLPKLDPASLRLTADTPGFIVSGPVAAKDAATPNILRLNYRLTLADTAAWGQSSTALRFAPTGDPQSDKALKIYVVPVTANIIGPIHAVPSIVAFSSVTVSHDLVERKVLLSTRSDVTVGAFDVVCGSPEISAKIVSAPGSDGRRGCLIVDLRGNVHPGVIDTNVTIFQKMGAEGQSQHIPGRLVIPVYGYVVNATSPF